MTPLARHRLQNECAGAGDGRPRSVEYPVGQAERPNFAKEGNHDRRRLCHTRPHRAGYSRPSHSRTGGPHTGHPHVSRPCTCYPRTGHPRTSRSSYLPPARADPHRGPARTRHPGCARPRAGPQRGAHRPARRAHLHRRRALLLHHGLCWTYPSRQRDLYAPVRLPAGGAGGARPQRGASPRHARRGLPLHLGGPGGRERRQRLHHQPLLRPRALPGLRHHRPQRGRLPLGAHPAHAHRPARRRRGRLHPRPRGRGRLRRLRLHPPGGRRRRAGRPPGRAGRPGLPRHRGLHPSDPARRGRRPGRLGGQYPPPP